MIVKNEEKYIKMCLENAMKLADEVIIVDTGSTDKTKEIIKEVDQNIKIIDYKWEDDFSKARNISIENATGDWILILDADEKLLCDASKVREILENTQADGYKIPLYNIMSSSMVLYSAVYIKFFRNNKGYRYEGSIHEQVNVSKGITEKYILEENICKVIHYGYLTSVVKERNKADRNLKILKKQLKEKPNDPYVYYNIGASYMVTENYEEALKYFFKCNKVASKKSLTGLTLYEIDMAKRIAECLVKLDRYSECIEMIDNLLSDKAYEGYVDLEYIKGFCYYLKKDYKKAIQCFEKCIEIGETKKFTSMMGMGSFKPKLMMARCHGELKDELKAINCFMESVFNPNNFTHEGVDVFRTYLKITNRIEILEQLNKLVGEKH
jgi:glycosyltransferase involved in cell wall biosynthesis